MGLAAEGGSQERPEAARLCRSRALDKGGQATKGTWGMSWRQEALKGVEDCDKLGEIVKRVLIPRFPN